MGELYTFREFVKEKLPRYIGSALYEPLDPRCAVSHLFICERMDNSPIPHSNYNSVMTSFSGLEYGLEANRL